MTFGLAPGKLGFKIGDVLVGLKSGAEAGQDLMPAAQRVVAGMKAETTKAL